MSLTRYLPIPSDRMGILWSLLNIEGCAVIEYGPAGTTHYSMGLFAGLGIEQENSLFTTHMREDDVIMGDTSRLENAIIEVDRNFAPKVIFICASSSAAVIGTDLKGVCTMLQPNVNAKLMSFEQGGFRGDYSAGIRTAYSFIAEHLVEKREEKLETKYNIIGASVGSYRCKADTIEIERLMREAFGMTAHARLCLETDIETIRTMGEASLNLVIRPEGIDAAKKLEEKCGTRYVSGAPYGYTGTAEWLRSVAEVISKQPNEALIASLEAKQREAAQYRMYARMLKRDRPQAFLYGDYETVSGLSAFLESIGVKAEKRICKHALLSVPQPNEGMEYHRTELERIGDFKSARNALILADDQLKRLCDKSCTYMRISTPVIDGAQVAVHMPIMGDRGADMLMEYVEEYFNTLK